MKITKLIGKKVLDVNANAVGKVIDVDVNFDDYTVNNVILNTGELSLRKIPYEVAPENIGKVGDYLLLKIDKSEIIDQEKKDDDSFDVKIVDPSELEEDKEEK